MIREVKIARGTARKGRTSVIITLKQIVVNAPAELRESLGDLPDKALLDRCAGYRVKAVDSTTASAKHTPRALARRWLEFDTEITAHDAVLDDLTAQASPTLREGYGIGPDCAAEILIVFGDNPERNRSEAAFAKLCGTCPIPASSAMTNKHRLYRGGHRQANAALYRTVIVRMRFHQPTIDYVARRTAEGLTKEDIIRCLKRFLAREVCQAVMTDHRTRQGLRQRHEQEVLIYRGVNALAETINGRYKTELIHQKQVSGYERGIHVPQTELLIRIAETFGVSLDHLAFADRDNTDHAGIADRELLEKLQALDQLPDTERAVVKSVLDTYITKHRIQQLTGTGEPAA